MYQSGAFQQHAPGPGGAPSLGSMAIVVVTRLTSSGGWSQLKGEPSAWAMSTARGPWEGLAPLKKLSLDLHSWRLGPRGAYRRLNNSRIHRNVDRTTKGILSEPRPPWLLLSYELHRTARPSRLDMLSEG